MVEREPPGCPGQTGAAGGWSLPITQKAQTVVPATPATDINILPCQVCGQQRELQASTEGDLRSAVGSGDRM